jgi:autotransporter-associated beta strand protein
MKPFSVFRAAFFYCLLTVLPVAAQTNFAVLTTDGAWTWYNDSRAIFHNGKLYFGFVRAADSKTTLSAFDLNSGQATSLWTAAFTQLDDHNNPGLLAKTDGTLLAIFSRHISDQYFAYRRSSVTNPVSPAGWNAEQSVPASGASMTYANPFQLSNESGKIYNFCRNQNFNPTVYTSTDGGNSWSAPQLFIQTGTGGTIRPYVKYSSNGSNRIDFLYTDGHPRDVANSLYHLYYQSNAFYKTDGTFVKNYSALPILHDSGERGSVIYQYNAADSPSPDQWIPTGRAWCWETASQTNGDPACVFTVQRDLVTGPTQGTDDRIYYYYARWTGSAWQKKFIAQAGRPIYAAENDYAGGICIDPLDVNTIYISSNAQNPFALTDTTNVTLRANSRYEIWRGVTADGGLTFSWTQITTNSAVDNFRPYVPRRNGGERCVLWFRGTYSSYASYSCSIVGLFTTAVPVQSNAVVILPPQIPPTQIKKANNRTNLNLSASWVDGVVPNAGNVAMWDNTLSGENNCLLGANSSWSGILITNHSGDVNIGSASTLTLGASGIDIRSPLISLGIVCNLALGAGDQVWRIGGLQVSLTTGTFSRASGSTLNIQGTASSTMASINANDGTLPSSGIIGPWATVNAGTNTRYATISGGNLTGYTGFSSTFAWATTIPNFTNFEISATSTAIGFDRMCNTIRWTGGAATQNYGSGSSANRLWVRGILNAGSGTLTFAKVSGTPTFVPGTNSTSATRELVLNAASAGIVLGVPIADNAAGASTVIVTGTGTNSVTLNAPNTYTGGTMLNAGTLNLGNASGLGSTSGTLAVNGGILDLGNFSATVGAATINGGILQNGTLTATSFTANNPNSAGVGAVLAGASTPLVKNNFGTLVLGAQNTYGGLTTVNAGNLNLPGSIAGPVTVAGGILSGNGTIYGAVTNQSGTLAPGADANSIGTLTINNSLTLQPGSTTFIKVSKNGDGVVNDAFVGLTNLNCGGTIIVTNIGANALAAGDTFQIFSAASFSGNFSATNFPTLGANLFWTNRLALDGTLAVLSSVANYSTNITAGLSGTNVALSWPASHLGWILQMQTNALGTGLSTNWYDLPETAALTGTNFQVNPTLNGVYFRLRHP